MSRSDGNRGSSARFCRPGGGGSRCGPSGPTVPERGSRCSSRDPCRRPRTGRPPDARSSGRSAERLSAGFDGVGDPEPREGRSRAGRLPPDRLPPDRLPPDRLLPDRLPPPGRPRSPGRCPLFWFTCQSSLPRVREAKAAVPTVFPQLSAAIVDSIDDCFGSRFHRFRRKARRAYDPKDECTEGHRRSGLSIPASAA